MSTTFSLACRDCKSHIWIAQGHRDGSCGHLYAGPKCTPALYDFLVLHRGHSLVYDENVESFIGDYEEVGPYAEAKETA